MIQTYVSIIIACFLIALLSMYLPIFRSDTRQWKKKSKKQRFVSNFLTMSILAVITLTYGFYQEANAPTWFEEELESGEMEYYQIRDESEVDNFDIVYEIKKGSDQERTCEMIETICRELDKGSSKNKVYAENDGYIIKENGAIVGIVAVFEKPHGILLKFNWWVV